MVQFGLLNHPERIFNVDEKGLRLCQHRASKVLVRKGVKRNYVRGKEHGENVTYVGCGNALGTVVPPFILFKGKLKNRSFEDNLPPGSEVHMTQKGSMTAPTFVKFLNHLAKYKPAGEFLRNEIEKCVIT